MNYLVDYHMHSTYSIDGSSTIHELCQSAVSKGIKEIAITDHFEPTPGDPFYLPYDQKGYWSDITKAKQRFKGKLKIRLGVELGQPFYFQEGTKAILRNFPYDYVIASAHKLPDGRDMSEMDYGRITEADICELYLKQLGELLKWEDFDCIGHLDLIKRYSAGVYGKNLSLTCQYELLTQVLNRVIAKGKGIEINTSGLRQKPKETMPGLDVLSMYHDLGGEILTLGSDAHKAEDIGKGINEAVIIAAQAGFRFITAFENRKPQQICITDKRAFTACHR